MKRLSGSLTPDHKMVFFNTTNPQFAGLQVIKDPAMVSNVCKPLPSASWLLASQCQLLAAAIIDCRCSCRIMPYSSHPKLCALVYRLWCLMSAVQRASTCPDFCCQLAPHATAVSDSAGTWQSAYVSAIAMACCSAHGGCCCVAAAHANVHCHCNSSQQLRISSIA